MFETTTSHFADRNLAAMEAAIKELGTRVQQLESENNLEESFAYKLDRELQAVQSELSNQKAKFESLNVFYISKIFFICLYTTNISEQLQKNAK